MGDMGIGLKGEEELHVLLREAAQSFGIAKGSADPVILHSARD
jgi:hypothetical protein